METKKSAITIPDEQFLKWLEQAKLHSPDGQQAMLQLLEYYEPEMQQLSRYMRMPHEDAMQTLRLELIQMVRKPT